MVNHIIKYSLKNQQRFAGLVLVDISIIWWKCPGQYDIVKATWLGSKSSPKTMFIIILNQLWNH